MNKSKLPKAEFSPLFAFGFHHKTEAELKTILVDAFPLSATRQSLWLNLLWLREKLIDLKISCQIWLDGSFLTQKINPDDIDMIIELDFEKYKNPNLNQQNFLLSLRRLEYHDLPKDAPKKLHTFIIYSAPFGHLKWPSYQQYKQQWVNDFGYSLIKREPKGIAIFEVKP